MNNPLDKFSRTQILWLINEYIHNAKYRAVLEDRFLNGFTYEKIAELHDLSDRQVKRIVYKSMEKLSAPVLELINNN